MRRAIGFVTMLLSGIATIGCLAGAILVWGVRPSLLNTSADLMDRADAALIVAEEKTGTAGELVKRIRAAVDPIADKILDMADRPGRTPEEEKESSALKERIEARLEQVDAIANAAETAVASLQKASLLANSLRRPGAPTNEDLQDRTQALAALAKSIKALRSILDRIRDNKEVRKQAADEILGLTRTVNDNLTSVDARLQEIHQRAVELRMDVAEARGSFPDLVTRSAVIATVLLVWLALGQVALAAWGWRRMVSARTLG